MIPNNSVCILRLFDYHFWIFIFWFFIFNHTLREKSLESPETRALIQNLLLWNGRNSFEDKIGRKVSPNHDKSVLDIYLFRMFVKRWFWWRNEKVDIFHRKRACKLSQITKGATHCTLPFSNYTSSFFSNFKLHHSSSHDLISSTLISDDPSSENPILSSSHLTKSPKSP